MCLAGDGGGKGPLRNRRGVDLAGEGETPEGSGLEDWLRRKGLSQGLEVEERAEVALFGFGAAAAAPPTESSPPLAAGVGGGW